MSRFSRARQVRDPVEALIAGRGDCPCMKKVKPPVAPEGCAEPYLVGNVRDPGFESISGTIPEDYGNVPYWQDFDPAIWGTTRGWDISTANPRSGTQHIRLDHENGFTPEHTAPGDAVYVCEFAWCDNPAFSWGWVSLINPGDIATFSLWSMVNDISSGDPRVWTGLYFNNASGSFITDVSQNHVLTTSYAQYSTNGVAPAGSKYLTCYIGASHALGTSLPNPIALDVDDLTVSIV